MLKISIIEDVSLKMINIRSQLHLTGANELKYQNLDVEYCIFFKLNSK